MPSEAATQPTSLLNPIAIRALGKLFAELSPDARYLIVKRNGRAAVIDLHGTARAGRVMVVRVEDEKMFAVST